MMASEWVAVSIFASFGGALLVTRLNDPTRARAWTLVSHGIALLSAIIGWLLFSNNGPDPRAVERYGGWLSLDSLSAPLGPLAALVFLITTLVTLKTKIRRFSFTGSLVSEGITLATLACREPWGIIAGLALGVWGCSSWGNCSKTTREQNDLTSGGQASHCSWR